MPVSYTHLDVYKRQAITSSLSSAVSDTALISATTAALAMSTLSPSAAVTASLAVSYTHLMDLAALRIGEIGQVK